MNRNALLILCEFALLTAGGVLLVAALVLWLPLFAVACLARRLRRRGASEREVAPMVEALRLGAVPSAGPERMARMFGAARTGKEWQSQ